MNQPTTATHNADADTAYRGKLRELAGLLQALAGECQHAKPGTLGTLHEMVRGLGGTVEMHDLITFDRRTWKHAADLNATAHRVRLAVDALKQYDRPTADDFASAARLIGEAIDALPHEDLDE